MDLDDSIKWLAQVHSGYCYPKSLDDIDKSLPYFNVRRGGGGDYLVDIYNYAVHDNAPRMPFLAQYLIRNVFPHVQGDMTGYYSVQLHDTYTYLEDGKMYDDVLTFGKRKTDKGPVVIPDCYFLGDWGGKYQGLVDNNSWESKLDKVIFVGSTTGSRDPLKNARINTCLWARDKPECNFYITNIVQMDPASVLNAIPSMPSICKRPMSLEDQMKYKYMLLIDGNTNKWTVDTFFTKSLSFMMPSDDMLWYYPLLQEGTHYVAVDHDTMIDKVKYFNANPKEAQFIVENGNKLASKLFNADICQKYLVELFEAIAHNK